MRVALIFAAAIAVVNGFGRFAYALLLPVMRQDLQWDYALSGWLNTANSLGYGIGALVGMLLVSRLKPATLFVCGLLVTVVTLAICAFTHSLWLMMLLRFISGCGSAWVFACGGALIAAHYSPEKAPSAIAIYYAGGGLGICLSGILLFPVLNPTDQSQFHLSWQEGWFLLGVFGLLMALWPAKIATSIGGTKANLSSEKMAVKPFTPIILAYFLYGVGYIVYMTFVVAWMREMRLSVSGSITVWLVLGVASMLSGLVWRSIMTHWWPAHTFAAATLCSCLGTAIPLLDQSIYSLWVSAIFVGGSFFMVPGAMMALARRSLPSHQLAKMMNLFTFVFAIGQGLGPVIAGWIADSKSMNMAMAFGAFTLLISALIAMTQKNPNT